MTNQANNISLNVQRHQDTLVLNMTPSGHPSHQDFKKLSQMMDTAVYAIPSANIALLVDLSELKSVSARSAWNELLHGLRIGSEFNRIAIVGHNHWHNFLIRATSWLISPNLRVFQQKDQAADWVLAA